MAIDDWVNFISFESSYDTDLEDEGFKESEESCLNTAPFDTNDEYDSSTFLEWCALKRT